MIIRRRTFVAGDMSGAALPVRHESGGRQGGGGLVDNVDDVGAGLLEDIQENGALGVVLALDSHVGWRRYGLTNVPDPDRATVVISEHNVVGTARRPGPAIDHGN